MADPIDIMDPEYAMPGELDRPRRDIPTLTGPELASMRQDSAEQRIANLERATFEQGRTIADLQARLDALGANLVRAVNGVGRAL
jgi:hypothetical protein